MARVILRRAARDISNTTAHIQAMSADTGRRERLIRRCNRRRSPCHGPSVVVAVTYLLQSGVVPDGTYPIPGYTAPTTVVCVES
jgi:hypothetical protein